MGVVPLTCCQPHPTARHPRSTRTWKNDTYYFFLFYNPHLFRICHTNNLKKESSLASRKPAWTINRMCFNMQPQTGFSASSSSLWKLKCNICVSLTKLNHRLWLDQVFKSFPEMFTGHFALCLKRWLTKNLLWFFLWHLNPNLSHDIWSQCRNCR